MNEVWIAGQATDYEGFEIYAVYATAEEGKAVLEKTMRRRKDRPPKWLYDEADRTWFFRPRGLGMSYEVRCYTVGDSDE